MGESSAVKWGPRKQALKPVTETAEVATGAQRATGLGRLPGPVEADFQLTAPRVPPVPVDDRRRAPRAVKRAFDIAGSLFVFILASPILIAVAVAIKLDTPGPIVFRQRRVGRDGKAFWMLKFRSMVEGAEEQLSSLRERNEADGIFKLSDDPRITRVGRLIRRHYVDELPQVLNVLRGEMSLVGPRPLPLDEDQRIEGHHRRRLDVAPGITGPWQVLGSSRVPLREMVRLDYRYATTWSLGSDLRILALTVGSVIRGRGL